MIRHTDLYLDRHNYPLGEEFDSGTTRPQRTVDSALVAWQEEGSVRKEWILTSKIE